MERYKYCDVPEAFAPNYGLNLRRVLTAKSPYETYRCNVPNLSTSFYLVVNDVVVPSQGHTAALPEGVEVCSLCEASTKMPDFIGEYYDKAASKSEDGVTAVNTLLVQDGILIYIPDGVQLKNPIQLVNVATASKAPLMSNRRLLVVAGKGAKASVLLCDHAAPGVSALTTQVVEVFADEMAEISLYNIEETADEIVRFSNLYAELQKNSRVSCNGVMLTCGASRNILDPSTIKDCCARRSLDFWHNAIKFFIF